jgi:hypothetical protein
MADCVGKPTLYVGEPSALRQVAEVDFRSRSQLCNGPGERRRMACPDHRSDSFLPLLAIARLDGGERADLAAFGKAQRGRNGFPVRMIERIAAVRIVNARCMTVLL